MAAGLEAAAEQEGWRPDGLASGRGAGGAAGAVTAPCARRPSPQETGAPRPRPGRVLVLRSRHAAPAAASAPHHHCAADGALRSGTRARRARPAALAAAASAIWAAGSAGGAAQGVWAPLALRALHVHPPFFLNKLLVTI
uniref:Uncharacterized protein n=2 Tax=Rangifer tarandus platyrhynchus TaxID=3082113 RepID=A0ACB0E281_RANTA|nr:unnamed protein product [Rangifer tarandus platyrhynchus]CAI9694627.1 unnamed protein product [Rangifer tarandus platyrhynchus]